MTRNLYIGVDILAVIDPPPCGALQATHDLFEQIIASNPPERMEAIAEEIMQKQPQVIALQEVYRITTQFPSNSLACDQSGCVFDNFTENEDGSITFDTDAEDVVFDYLDLLLEALAARGLQYRVVEDAVAWESDFEIPSWNLVPVPGLGCVPADGALPTDVRAQDRDVILVRSDVETEDEYNDNYSVLLPFPIPTGDPVHPFVRVIIVRGYGSTDLKYQGRTYRFVNTHLEMDDQSDPGSFVNLIQAAQAQQLIGALASEALPLVVAGDFNSSPDPADFTMSYELMVSAGYTDIWDQFGGRPGDTCCQVADLSNLKSALFKRIDLILVRPSADTRFLPSPAWVTGDRQSGKTASGLWASDHAGVAAMLKLKR
jgi:endonuclease/exonuclease/phosphatase family metal-dependent hydrolase